MASTPRCLSNQLTSLDDESAAGSSRKQGSQEDAKGTINRHVFDTICANFRIEYVLMKLRKIPRTPHGATRGSLAMAYSRQIWRNAVAVSCRLSGSYWTAFCRLLVIEKKIFVGDAALARVKALQTGSPGWALHRANSNRSDSACQSRGPPAPGGNTSQFSLLADSCGFQTMRSDDATTSVKPRAAYCKHDSSKLRSSTK